MPNTILSQGSVTIDGPSGAFTIKHITPGTYKADPGGPKNMRQSTSGGSLVYKDYSENFATITFSIPALTPGSETIVALREFWRQNQNGFTGTLQAEDTGEMYQGVMLRGYPSTLVDDGSIDLEFTAESLVT